jgi:hypothetical protein
MEARGVCQGGPVGTREPILDALHIHDAKGENNHIIPQRGKSGENVSWKFSKTVAV